MHAFLPRSYLMPVRDEEAESQRKARSRQARQTRRSTQGVTLTELKEAQRAFGYLSSDRQTDRPRNEASLVSGLTEERGEPKTAMSKDPEQHSPRWNREVDKIGNRRPRVGIRADCPPTLVSSPSSSGTFICPSSNLTERLPGWGLDRNGNEWRNANQSDTDNPSELVLELREQQQVCDSDLAGFPYWPHEHDRTSRLDSATGAGPTDSNMDRLLGRTSSYTRRENRMAALSRMEDDGTSKDFKKMYEDALAENEKLKTRLEDSKKELAKIRSQLEKVTQKQDRISERSSVLETERREKRTLEKKVSQMEEEIKVLTELKSDNQRLKDENGALIRVISKLSK